MCVFVFFVTGCTMLVGPTGPSSGNTLPQVVTVRFAVFGDAEPKPTPSFVFLSAAVDAVNELNRRLPIDFVAGVGDIAHQGLEQQYENATIEIRRLEVPFFTIMGNEELAGDSERFLEYAREWNDDCGLIPSPSYAFEWNGVYFVFATASIDRRDFSDADIDWILEQLDDAYDKHVVLFTHLPAPMIFTEATSDRTIQTERFGEVLAHPNIRLVFSGHLHLNPHQGRYLVTKNGIHHVNVPPLERTKAPPGAPHEPYFLLVTIFDIGSVLLQAYDLIARDFDQQIERLVLLSASE